MKPLLLLTFSLFFLSACVSVSPTPTSTQTATATGIPAATGIATAIPPTTTASPAAAAACSPQPIVVPTRPAEVPPTNGLDKTTGLHMTGTYQQLDPVRYRLKVSGLVDHPLNLTLDDLRCMPKVSAAPPLVCGGFFTDVATWAGVPLSEILKQAGVQPGAKTLVMLAADRYQASVPLDKALEQGSFLAYEWHGQPVPILHGFPVRVVIPGYSGWAWVKWLIEIQVK